MSPPPIPGGSIDNSSNWIAWARSLANTTEAVLESVSIVPPGKASALRMSSVPPSTVVPPV